jgi:hypothetical protein
MSFGCSYLLLYTFGVTLNFINSYSTDFSIIKTLSNFLVLSLTLGIDYIYVSFYKIANAYKLWVRSNGLEIYPGAFVGLISIFYVIYHIIRSIVIILECLLNILLLLFKFIRAFYMTHYFMLHFFSFILFLTSLYYHYISFSHSFVHPC